MITLDGAQLFDKTVAHGLNINKVLVAARIENERRGVNNGESWGLIPLNAPFKADPVTAVQHDVFEHTSQDDGSVGFEAAAVLGAHSYEQRQPKQSSFFGLFFSGSAFPGHMMLLEKLEEEYPFHPLIYTPRTELGQQCFDECLNATHERIVVASDVRERYAPWAAFGVDVQDALFGDAKMYGKLGTWVQNTVSDAMGFGRHYDDRKAESVEILVHGFDAFVTTYHPDGKVNSIHTFDNDAS